MITKIYKSNGNCFILILKSFKKEVVKGVFYNFGNKNISIVKSFDFKVIIKILTTSWVVNLTTTYIDFKNIK